MSSAPVDFAKGLKSVLYGYGDEYNPLPETVSLMNQIVQEYILAVTDEACDVAAEHGVKPGGKLEVESVLYVMRRDERKSQRIKELLSMQREITETRNQRLKDEKHFNSEKQHKDAEAAGKARAAAGRG